MIHVIATIEIAEGKREEFLNEFRQLMPKVHAEQGCIEYGPAIDVATNIPVQLPIRNHAVVVLEKWENIPALEDHLKAPHMLEYREKVKGLVNGVQLQVLRPA